MNRAYFQASNWYRAITLTERIASLSVLANQIQNKQINADFAQNRMERWRDQDPFPKESYFAERLAMDGIDDEKFLSLLGEPIEAVQERFPETPTWLKQIAEAFSTNSEQFHLPEATQNVETSWFLYLVEPLICQGLNRLSEGIESLSQQHSELPFEPKTVTEMLLTNLTIQLRQILNRTLVLELNVARLQGLLTGDTPQERFRSFVERLRQRDVALSILQEYPVLARQTTICINHWLTFSLEFLHHLCADWHEIRAKFSPKHEPGLLVELLGGAGDSHRGGRSVRIAKFSSGLQLVYKPRSLAVDVHFQELLTWLNERGDHPPFRILKLLDRGNYGWVEFVKAQSCKTLAEIQRFYQRQGGYLALLYALQATDFHSENLIAAGEHPILVDLEALFHPKVGKMDNSQANLVVSDKIADSVLGIGLLPQRVWGNAQSEGIDLSGLGSKHGQLTPNQIPYWEDMGTDEMRLARKRMEMPPDQNLPTLDGANVNLLEYTEEILNGFTNIYQLLLKYREDLLSKQGLIAAFAEDEVRVILGLTRTYSFLLDGSFHPDLLRDALERDRHFDLLWLQIQYRSYLKQAIAAEREDLLRGDIPLFVTHPNSRDVWGSCGQCLKDFLEEASIDMVYRRLEKLSDLDMAQQQWFIRASLATVYMGLSNAAFPGYSIAEPQIIANRDQLLAAARAIGDRLDFLAVRGEEDASWIGLTFLGERHWSLASLGFDLYDGLPGIILFLAYLGKATEEESYTNLARAAFRTMRSQIEELRSGLKQIGAFGGWGGIIYTLTHLAVLWNQPELMTEAEKIIECLPDLIEQDTQFDIISGAAGCISSLLALYKCKPADDTLTVAIKCGDLLIARAEMMAHGVGWTWKDEMFEEKPLTGFSHGAAGIAASLLELAAVTGEQRFATTAIAAIEYERSHFLPEAGNWLDLRNFTNTVLADKDDQNLCMNAWCHGAPGIGLARLRSLPHLDDAEIRSEIDTALKTTLAEGFGNNHSLCHGDLGNLELLLQASLTLDKFQWQPQVDRFAAIILESINQHGWLCGVPSGVETPGLMTGLAGIGYGLLRLAAPERIPSVLVLEPPKLKGVVQKTAEFALTA
ncbi:type 2 lantipeptide synthetase LanM family protein [Nostoc sp. CHAB 5784]|uniref:type 2 lanthipeptide synthetase LanM family protein n=1 Tax=Nostoc mirabile TaxID=2907820 RepID=UPI001E2FF4A1|nr:type 2 lanthipeptide synthetase LanM family protein [Nostoc mirabile]MCC5669529.1 type 2 lantipeptide synthetase LanM family protein [Nostoc mirabile CHAB5784]